MANDNVNYSKKVNALLDEMPDFVADFILNFKNSENPSTMLQYTRDIYDFLRFMVNTMPDHDGKDIKDLTLDDLSKLTSLDVNRYLTLIRSSKDRRFTKLRNDVIEKNNVPSNHKASTIKRLRATLSSMFSFFMTSGRLKSNPAAARGNNKTTKKELIYLTNAQQTKLLNTVRTGENLAGKAATHHERYVMRDSAMILLLLDTGLRVSEMLTTNIADYDFDSCCVHVVRKGGDSDVVSFSDECASYLMEYFDAQRARFLISDDQIPSFTTLQGERLGVRAVENLVKKYAEASLGTAKGKSITPHKLRSSFAMSFYEASGNDILLLKEKLHHSSINTTKIYTEAAPGRKEDTRNILQGLR